MKKSDIVCRLFRRKRIYDAVTSAEGMHMSCTEVHLDLSKGTLTIRNSYCQLLFSRAVTAYKQTVKQFKKPVSPAGWSIRSKKATCSGAKSILMWKFPISNFDIEMEGDVDLVKDAEGVRIYGPLGSRRCRRVSRT